MQPALKPAIFEWQIGLHDYFLSKVKILKLKLRTEFTGLLKNDKFGSSFVLVKENCPNSMIATQKIANLRPDRVLRKANNIYALY